MSLLLASVLTLGQLEPNHAQQNEVMITRATLDIGSGDTKITIAEVNPRINKITKVWHQTHKAVELRKDLASSQNSELSAGIKERLIKTLQAMQEDAERFGAKEWCAVATSVFRKAKNSFEFLQDVEKATKIKINVISQDEEAEVGFATAVAVSGDAPENIIAWDSGSGSFQISALNKDEKVQMYGAEFGFVSALEALWRIRGMPFKNCPGPISMQEAHALIKEIQSKLPATLSWMENPTKKIVAIGGNTSIFSIGEIATGKSSFTKDDIFTAICNFSGKEDEELCHFPRPHEVMIGLIFTYAVMDHCKFEQITNYVTNGSCEGLLITPRFWSKTRAAIDIGSGSTKLCVADVNPQTNKITKIWHTQSKALELHRDLTHSMDGQLSQAMKEKMISTIKNMQADLESFNITQWHAVATSSLRKAKNGPEFLADVEQATGLKIDIISQAEEAEIGFLTAVHESQSPADTIIALDTGSGSFQISTLIDAKVEMFGAEVGNLPALEAIFAIRGQPIKDTSPNPISHQELLQLIAALQSKLPPIPSWMTNSNKKIISIGAQKNAVIATGKSDFTKQDLYEAIFELCEKSDVQLTHFPNPKEAIVRLALLYAVMDHCHFDQISFCNKKTKGNCEGLLLTPHFWSTK